MSAGTSTACGVACYDGRRFAVRSRRLVSFVNRHLACIEYEVTSLDREAR